MYPAQKRKLKCGVDKSTSSRYQRHCGQDPVPPGRYAILWRWCTWGFGTNYHGSQKEPGTDYETDYWDGRKWKKGNSGRKHHQRWCQCGWKRTSSHHLYPNSTTWWMITAARSIGPHTVKCTVCGKRFGEMFCGWKYGTGSVWCIEHLQEPLTLKSDDGHRKAKTYEAIVTMITFQELSIPESSMHWYMNYAARA